MHSLPLTLSATLVATLGFASMAQSARADVPDWQLTLESGLVFTQRNDARIPGDGGSDLSLVDDLHSPVQPAFRLRPTLRLGERHELTALWAPLTIAARGQVDRDIQFLDASYSAGTPLLAVYRFDSYRLGYRYDLVHSDRWRLAVGVTAKLRSAEVSLYGEHARRKTDLGVVPLGHLLLEWRSQASSMGLRLEADALAAPQGRAEDVLLALTWALSPKAELYAGYRTLEGGSDIDEVYTFAWLHYGVLGLSFRH
jgi:hypothetical protein